MINEDFIDILEFSEEKQPHDDDETLNPVLKEDEFLELENVEQVGEKDVLENDSFIIKIYKIDDIPNEIEIECKCGKKTSIKLNYNAESTDAASEVEPSDESNKKDEDGNLSPEQNTVTENQTSEVVTANENDKEVDQENAVFEEGIPAETIDVTPKHDATIEPEQPEKSEQTEQPQENKSAGE